MAGIFASVETDIQKLRRLKAEIENVKKALKGIDVNVSIDIAEGMEAQLQSLMKQYDLLVQKVSEAEGKIMLSTKRINDASEKIIKAQEQLSKGAGQNSQSDNGNGAGTANRAETSSVQAQAKAYDELAAEIDDVLGTRAENVKRMIDEQRAIDLIKREIKELGKYQTESSTLSSTQQMRLEQLNSSLMTHKAALSEVRQTLMNNAKLDNAASTSMKGLSQSLSRMRIAYRELTEEERDSPFGKELLASIQQADARIKDLDATIGNHQRNVGDYAKGYNGLNMSVQQIVRELPSATMGLNMFFLAISNNLPILADEIKRAKAANEELKASGSTGIPVWKQLVSSLFSWQSAMMVGITLLTVYGKDLGEWVMGLFNARKEVDLLAGEQAKLSEAMASTRKEAGAEIGNLRVLYARTQDVTLSMEARLAAAKKLQDQYPSYFGKLEKETILAGNASAAYRQLTKDIIASARARAAQERINELAAQQLQQQRGATADNNYKTIYKSQYEKAKKYLSSERGKAAGYHYMLSNNAYAAGRTLIDTKLVKEYAEQLNIAREYEARLGRLENHQKNIGKLEKQMQGYTRYINDAADATVRLEAEAPKKERQKKDTSDADERKKAQEELGKDLLALQQKNRDDEISLLRDGTAKKIAEIDNDYEKRKAEIDKQEAEFRRKNKEAGLTGLGADGITDEQAEALSKARDIAAKEKEREMQDLYSAEVEQMRSYLKEYGTYQQKKLAIAEEYAQKIKEAQNKGERLRMEKERDKAMADVNLSAIRQDIDWAGVFGEFGTMFRGEIERSLKSLREYMKSDEFKNMSPTDQAQIVDAVENLRGKVTGNLADVDFGKIGELTNELQNAQLKMIAARNAEIVAYKALTAAQEKYRAAMESGTEVERTAAKADLDAAQETADKMSAAYGQAVGEFTATGNSLKDATASAVDAIDSVSSAISQIKGGSLSGAYEGLEKLSGTLGKSLSAMSGLFGKAGSALTKFSSSLGGATGEIVSAALGLLDLLKEGIGSIFADLSDLVYGAIDGVLDDLMSGDIVMKPLKSTVMGIGSILDTITYGGFSSWVGNGDSDETYAEDMARLTESNRDLETAIDNLSDKMADANITDATEMYGMQMDAARQWMENLQEQLRRSGDASSRGFLGIGSEHSSNYRINEGMSAADWNAVSKAAGTSVRSAQDFWELTSEQMSDVANYATTQYSRIKDLADDGKENAAQFMDEYAGMWQELNEIQDAYNEKVTGTSFDSLSDGFRSALLDMENDTETFADNFSSMMRRAIVDSMMSEEYNDRLRQWHENFKKAMESGGELSAPERTALQKEWETMVKDAQEERDRLFEAMGWDGSSSGQQSGSSRGFGSEMTHEDAGELSGRFTAVYESNLRIEAAEQQQTVAITELQGSIGALTAQASGMYNIADETRTILVNSYMELQQIRENTGEIVKPIKQMQADMAEVKRNTSRL